MKRARGRGQQRAAAGGIEAVILGDQPVVEQHESVRIGAEEGGHVGMGNADLLAADHHRQPVVGRRLGRATQQRVAQRLDACALRGRQGSRVQRYSGRMCGNRITSRMLGASASSITKRSTPTPQPAVGGRPYSSARTKSAS